MMIHAIDWNGNNWANGCDFWGNDLSEVRGRAEDCGSICYNTPGCTHFSWTLWNGWINFQFSLILDF